MPENELPEIVELTIPLHRDRLVQLAAACRLLGQPIELWVTETIDQVANAQIQRAAIMQQRLDAAKRAAEGTQVKIIDPETRERITLPREEQPREPVIPAPRG